jgi:hypothetical protein
MENRYAHDLVKAMGENKQARELIKETMSHYGTSVGGDYVTFTFSGGAGRLVAETLVAASKIYDLVIKDLIEDSTKFYVPHRVVVNANGMEFEITKLLTIAEAEAMLEEKLLSQQARIHVDDKQLLDMIGLLQSGKINSGFNILNGLRAHMANWLEEYQFSKAEIKKSQEASE